MTRSSLRRQIILSRDTALGLLLVLALAAVCVGLGFWQYGRYETKHDQAAVVHSNYEAEPVALEDVLPTLTSPLAATDEWKQRSEEHTSELQSREKLVCRLLLEKK